MPEGIPGYLRIRVVNRSPLFWFNDGFEVTAGMTQTWWETFGTDATGTLNYWTADVGVPTIAANVCTVPAGARQHGGHTDWGDLTWDCRFQYNSAAGSALFIIHYVDANNFIYARVQTNSFDIRKVVATVDTSVAVTTPALTNGNQYWCRFAASGTTYSASLFNDSAGAVGTNVAGSNPSGTIADAAIQNGYVGLQAVTHNLVCGGAFTNVCRVYGTGPDGTQGQVWTPIVTAGEPAFAWSKLSPKAGTYHASIQIANASGDGAWQQTIRLFSGSNVTLSAQAKASAGTANVAAGGLTTSNAGTSYAAVTTTGAITVNPTVSCHYSGAVGTAYFDSVAILNSAWLITDELPHLHQASYEVRAMQPGNPGSSAIGTFTVPLFPPGSEQYAAAKAIYDQLDYFHRVEMYLSHDGASLGNLVFAGFITGIRKGLGANPVFELTGVSDIGLLNYCKPFPAEYFSLSYGTGLNTTADYRQAHQYFATNELGAADAFNPYTSANYISTLLPSLTAGTWTADTDDGLSVVKCSTGTGAILLSKTGAMANATTHRAFVEITGRILPSNDATNAGGCGVGISFSNSDGQTSLVGWIRSKKNGVNWDLDVITNAYVAGVLTQVVSSNAFTTTQDPDGYISFSIALLAGSPITSQGPSLVVNGRTIFWPGGTLGSLWSDAGTVTTYPFAAFMAATTGTATAYLTNLTQQVRYSDDLNSTTAIIKPGSIGTPARSLPVWTTCDPTFLEILTRIATREGWYWRYTPQAFVGGKRTIGTLDLTTDPGTDRTTSVIFDRALGNLIDLELTANADGFATGAVVAGSSGTDGGGVAPWRDITTMTKYGVIDDQALAVTIPNYAEQRRAAYQIASNKIATSSAGSKTAMLLRDADTADKWRELDKISINDAELGINHLSTRVMSLTFTEGQVTQSVVLDQFSQDDASVPAKRFQQAVFMAASTYRSRS